MFLSDAELTAFRADVARMLPGTAVIQSPTYVSDGAGGGSVSYAASGTVACRIDPMMGRALEVAGREAIQVDYVLTVPYNATIQADYRVVIAAKQYEIIALAIDHSWNVSKRAYLARID